jgi:hypothetical protein
VVVVVVREALVTPWLIIAAGCSLLGHKCPRRAGMAHPPRQHQPAVCLTDLHAGASEG